MIRRVIGIAKCHEMLNIENEDERAKCEILVLKFSIEILLD